MKILGISLSTIVLIAVVVFITRRWGSQIPVVKSI